MSYFSSLSKEVVLPPSRQENAFLDGYVVNPKNDLHKRERVKGIPYTNPVQRASDMGPMGLANKFLKKNQEQSRLCSFLNFLESCDKYC